MSEYARIEVALDRISQQAMAQGTRVVSATRNRSACSLYLEQVDACLAQLLHGVAGGPHSAHVKEGHAHAMKGRPATQLGHKHIGRCCMAHQENRFLQWYRILLQCLTAMQTWILV